MTDAPGEFSTIDDSTLVSSDSIMGDAVALARLGPGKSIGPYLVLARRGVGRSGVLYHAYDPRSERHVALRLLPPHESRARDIEEARPKAIVELEAEAKALAAIRHRNLVAIHECGALHGVVYLVMDDLRGGTLRAWMDTPHDWREVLALFASIGAGLAALHRAELVHRDLRPDNVLFDDEGEPRIVDYAFHRGGFSSRRNTLLDGREDEETSAESLQAPLIRTGTWIGTPAYMAPEQYAGATIDGRADQFAFCVMLHEALYGQRPFEARTLEGLFLAIEDGRIKPAPSSAVPKRIREVLVRGLAHDPAARWPNMEALIDALVVEPAPASWRRRAAIAALATSLVAAALALSIQGPLATTPSASTTSPALVGPHAELVAQLDAADAQLRNGDPDGAREALALVEPALADAPAHLRARHHLIAAQAFGPAPEADRLIVDALLELTAEPELVDDATTRDIACELGLRQELRQIANATNKDDLVGAREHVGRARILLERQRSPNASIAEALSRWEEFYPP